ncbi:hypothetical protein HDV02_003922 [Globomyces sp. JEL0801]|nr:hypothetical protein HDV02_003922 [Globomyces sp. JEL0801]
MVQADASLNRCANISRKAMLVMTGIICLTAPLDPLTQRYKCAYLVLEDEDAKECDVKLWNDSLLPGACLQVMAGVCWDFDKGAMWLNAMAVTPLSLDVDQSVTLAIQLIIHGTVMADKTILCYMYDPTITKATEWSVKLVQMGEYTLPAKGKTVAIIGKLIGFKKQQFEVEVQNYEYCPRKMTEGPTPASSPGKKIRFNPTVPSTPKRNKVNGK